MISEERKQQKIEARKKIKKSIERKHDIIRLFELPENKDNKELLQELEDLNEKIKYNTRVELVGYDWDKEEKTKKREPAKEFIDYNGIISCTKCNEDKKISRDRWLKLKEKNKLEGYKCMGCRNGK